MAKSPKKVDSKTRPYWHIDAKWICGLLLGGAVIGLLWIGTATRLTSREVAVSLMTTVVAMQFSPDGLDDQAGFEQAKSEWLASGQTEIKPIEGMPVTLSREQVETLSARELRLELSRQIAEPLYDDGAEAFATSAFDDPIEQQKFTEDAQLLGLVSQQSNLRLKGVQWVGLAAVLLLAIPTIYFSAGIGRLVTPGIILVLASWIGTLVFGLSKLSLASSRSAESTSPGGLLGTLGQEGVIYLPTIMMGWVVAFGVGVGLLAVAVVCSMVRRWRSKHVTV